MHRILPVLGMLLVYLALSASVALPNFVLGLMVAIGIYALLHPEKLPVNWANIPSAFLALIRYLISLFGSVIRGGVQITRIVIHPELPINPGIVAAAPECESEIGRAIGAHSISLSPGELLIEMKEDGTMFIHSLDFRETERCIRDAQAKRKGLMRKIFDKNEA